MEVIQSLAASLQSVVAAARQRTTTRALPQVLAVLVAVLPAVTLAMAVRSVRARQAKAIPVLLQAARGIPVVAVALAGLAQITQGKAVWVSNTPSPVHRSTLLVVVAVLGIPVTVVTVAPAVVAAAQ